MKPPVRTLPKDDTAQKLKIAALVGKAARYIDANDKIKPLEAEKKKLSSELKEGAVAYGEKDEKGTYTLESEGVIIKSVASSSNQVDIVKALAVLERLNLVERCTTRVVDEKQLEIAFQEGLIDIEDINSFTTSVPGTPKISVSRKE